MIFFLRREVKDFEYAHSPVHRHGRNDLAVVIVQFVNQIGHIRYVLVVQEIMELLCIAGFQYLFKLFFQWLQ